MTIAAKLSRTLYETFGDESAEAMIDWMQGVEAHRSELRDLNDLTFSRLEVLLSELRAELRQEIHTEIADLRKEMGDRYADLLKWSFTFWIGSTVTLVLALIALEHFGR